MTDAQLAVLKDLADASATDRMHAHWTDAVRAALAEIERLRALCRTCCWCHITFATLAELREHCTQCETHPVAAERKRADEAQTERDRLQAQLTAAREHTP